MNTNPQGSGSTMQRLGAWLFCISTPIAALRFAFSVEQSTGNPGGGIIDTRALDQLGDAMFKPFMLLVCLTPALLLILPFMIWGFRPQAKWAYAGYPMALFTMSLFIFSKAVFPQSQDPATYTKSLEHGVVIPSKQATSSTPSPKPTQDPLNIAETHSLLGDLWPPGAELSSFSERSSSPSIAWPTIILRLPSDWNPGRAGEWLAQKAKPLNSTGDPVFSGNRPGDGRPVKIEIRRAVNGADAGHVDVIYTCAQ